MASTTASNPAALRRVRPDATNRSQDHGGHSSYVSTPAIQVRCADEVKYQVVDKLTAEFNATSSA
jgi:hypothetical protein